MGWGGERLGGTFKENDEQGTANRRHEKTV